MAARASYPRAWHGARCAIELARRQARRARLPVGAGARQRGVGPAQAQARCTLPRSVSARLARGPAATRSRSETGPPAGLSRCRGGGSHRLDHLPPGPCFSSPVFSPLSPTAALTTPPPPLPPPPRSQLFQFILKSPGASPLRDELRTGQSQWEVHGQLGKGAFGVVYKVRRPPWHCDTRMNG